MEIVGAASVPPWMRKVGRACTVPLALLALYALVGFLVLPPLARAKLETVATEAFGRRATLERLDFNPFTLQARLADFALADREPGRTLLRFEALEIDLSSATLWHWAPVFDALRLVRPHVELVRNDDGSYNVQDLIERVLSATGGTPQFSITNIEIGGASVSLDDRPHRRVVAVTDLGIGIPFLSSVPHDAKVRVTPRFEGSIDGAHFELAGNSSTPFS